jgi:hypothetical protein
VTSGIVLMLNALGHDYSWSFYLGLGMAVSGVINAITWRGDDS